MREDAQSRRQDPELKLANLKVWGGPADERQDYCALKTLKSGQSAL